MAALTGLAFGGLRFVRPRERSDAGMRPRRRMGCGQVNESMFALRSCPQQSTLWPTRDRALAD
jgi:hypothetical protein